MNLQQNNSNLQIAVIIVGVIVFFYAYFYFAHSEFLKDYIEKNVRHSQKNLFHFFVKKLAGLIILGLIPGVLYYFFIDTSFEKFGLTSQMIRVNFSVILVLAGIIICILFINQKVNKNRNSLQVSLKEWSVLLFSFNVTGWIVYLFAYEFLFRGILLTECYASFGFWPAIAINVVIYSAIHMVNGKEETIGALVFGFIACYFMLTKGTLWIPIFMHVFLSSFSDYFSIRFNNELSFIKPNK